MKTKPDNSPQNQQFNGLIAEYNTLRAEILKRVELRNSIVFGPLTFAGVLLGFGLTTPILALLYIIISMFLAGAWVQNDVLVSELGRYIRDNLEHSQTGLRWETFRQQSRIATGRTQRLRPSIIFSTGGVFLITQSVALVIAFSKIQVFTLLEWFLSTVAIVCMLITIYFFRYSSRHN
jgi:hypothetical protein